MRDRGTCANIHVYHFIRWTPQTSTGQHPATLSKVCIGGASYGPHLFRGSPTDPVKYYRQPRLPGFPGRNMLVKLTLQDG